MCANQGVTSVYIQIFQNDIIWDRKQLIVRAMDILRNRIVFNRYMLSLCTHDTLRCYAFAMKEIQ